jgi:hypothetical protein
MTVSYFAAKQRNSGRKSQSGQEKNNNNKKKTQRGMSSNKYESEHTTNPPKSATAVTVHMIPDREMKHTSTRPTYAVKVLEKESKSRNGTATLACRRAALAQTQQEPVLWWQ